jgi:hypothetical protein
MDIVLLILFFAASILEYWGVKKMFNLTLFGIVALFILMCLIGIFWYYVFGRDLRMAVASMFFFQLGVNINLYRKKQKSR